METESDEELMLRYQAGDAAGFDVLYQRHKTALYRYMMRYCHNSAVAEEMYQDVWMNLIKAQERYEPTANSRQCCIEWLTIESLTIIDDNKPHPKSL